MVAFHLHDFQHVKQEKLQTGTDHGRQCDSVCLDDGSVFIRDLRQLLYVLREYRYRQADYSP